MENNFDFYLTSMEIEPILNPRGCAILQTLWSEERQDYFLRIRIEPPINGREFYNEQNEIDELVVAARYLGSKLLPISEFPITVYVCYLVNKEVRQTSLVSRKDLQILFIGELYSSLEEAERAIRSKSSRI